MLHGDSNRSIEIRFDDDTATKRIGLVLLATDHTSERDFSSIVPSDQAAVYCNRIAFENPTTPQNLRAMQPRLAEGANLILPDEPLDVICYACTAASAVLGDDAVAQAIHRGKDSVPVVTPPLAARLAMKALGVRRISVLTPYIDETAAPVTRYFEDHGLDVSQTTNLGLDDDRRIARVSPNSIVAAAVQALAPDSEALFISCTALRSMEVAQSIEDKTGKPVIVSNQAASWMCLRLIGIEQPIAGFGALFSLPLPE